MTLLPDITGLRRPSRWRHVPFWLAGTLLALALLAPLLVNDVPLAARVAGHWSFPAVADLFGKAPTGPEDLSWKQWWARLPADADDLVVMPPWPYGPEETNNALFGAPPTAAHPFGNDDTGRDLLARIVHGAHTAVLIGGTAVLLAALLGVAIGAVAGLRRGLVDMLVQRVIEVFLCFPSLLFLLFAAAFFGDSQLGLVLVMAGLFWTSFARIVRGELLSLRERDYVQVARSLGVRELRLVTHHLLPQVRSQIGVTAAFAMANAVVAEATLSFLGLGPGALTSSWGTLLQQGREHAHLGTWHLWLFPALAIVGFVVLCHVLADRLRQS